MCGDRRSQPERSRAPQDGHTLLHSAVSGGHAAVAEKLLTAGAGKDAKNEVRGRGVRGDGDKEGFSCFFSRFRNARSFVGGFLEPSPETPAAMFMPKTP